MGREYTIPMSLLSQPVRGAMQVPRGAALCHPVSVKPPQCNSFIIQYPSGCPATIQWESTYYTDTHFVWFLVLFFEKKEDVDGVKV